jgi:hypothetical protein
MAAPKHRDEYHAWQEQGGWDDDLDEPIEVDHPWRRSHDLKGKFIGVELELEASNGESYYAILNALPVHNEAKDGPAPEAEEDATIDRHSGIEIIFPPISPAMLRDKKSYFYRAVDAINRANITDNPVNCGMHMNINCNGWPDLKKAIFVGMIHNMPRADLVRMGGRQLTDYCEQYRFESSFKRSIKKYGYEPDDCHDYACEHKEGGTRLECRFPAATTSMTIIARISYFLEYLEDFADEFHATSWINDWGTHKGMYDAFLNWLNNGEADAKAIAAFLTAEA